MEEIVFHHALPIQLRFNDVDKFGHVNNTVYFSFYDLGKTEYFVQSPNQKIPDRKTKCVIKTHINIKQNVIFGAKLKPV